MYRIVWVLCILLFWSNGVYASLPACAEGLTSVPLIAFENGVPFPVQDISFIIAFTARLNPSYSPAATSP